MSKEKNRGYSGDTSKEGDFGADSATRARNRTVMLTPEITGQVRARLAQETDETVEETSPVQEGVYDTSALENTRGSSGAFKVGQESSSFGSSYTPAAPSQHNAQPAQVKQQVFTSAGSQNNRVVWTKMTPLVGFLVSFDNDENGEVYELRSGRLIISSEPASGWSYMVVEDSSVSPMHAILRIDASGVVQVLDQLSEYGTRIKRFGSHEEEQISGEKSTIEHGDVIKFGERTFHVCILALNN